MSGHSNPKKWYKQTIDYRKGSLFYDMVLIKHQENKRKTTENYNPKSGILVTASCFFRSSMCAYTCVVVTLRCPNSFDSV